MKLRLMSALATGLALPALVGCGVGRSAPPPPLSAMLRHAAPAQCEVRLGERTFRLPAQAAALLQSLVDEPDKTREIHIEGETDIPYRCVGHFIYLAQRAGFERIGFISKPAME